MLGQNKNDFDEKWLKRDNSKVYKDFPKKKKPIIGFKNRKILGKELNKYIDYVDYDDVKELANMPEKDLNVVKVPVTKDQAKLYKGILNNNKDIKKMITQKRLETLKDEEVAKAYSSLIESRKLMNSVGSVKSGVKLSESAEITPKTKRLLNDMEQHLNETPDGQALLFSHLINGGTDVLEAGLKNRNIEYGRFLGKGNSGVTEEARQQDVKDFNDRKKRVMIVSSAGGEGLSMNDTTWEGVLDPHYNPEKMKQMEARGIRSGGLSHRPKEDRSVSVNRYLATMPKTLGVFKSRYKTPDEFIYEISKNKDKQNKMLFDLLKENRR